MKAEPASATAPTGGARLESAVIYVACGLYLVFLLKLLLFSRSLGSGRSVNLVPLASITQYLAGDSGRAALGNVVGNVLAFVPLGAYLAYFRRRASLVANVLIVVVVSVAVEVVQGVSAIGASDVDDVILNTLGGAIGVITLEILTLVLGTRSRARTTVAALSVVVLTVTGYLLFVLRLRL